MMLSATSKAAVGVEQKNVLVLHSYHRGLGWTDSIAKGIDETFLKSNYKIETFTEYMDTKRIFNAQYLDRLADLLKFKYNGRKFDVIILSDDYAFHFLLKWHDIIFPEVPVVFCGVNLFKDEFIKGAPSFTGVVESFSIKETIDAALTINPHLRRVYSIVDRTITGMANLKLLESVIPVFENHLEFITVTDKDMTEVTDEVSQLPPDSIILLLAFTSDRSGNTFSLEQSADLITAASNRPVYSFWDFHLNHGIIGGMLTTGISQGRAAADMALRILSGEAPVNIPVIKTSPNRYIFDYNTLKKFNISAEKLPIGSTIINRPPSFYEQYKRLVWQTLLLFGLLLAFTFVLTINLMRRRAAEARLKANEEKLRTVFENSVVGFFESTPEGRFVSVNPAFAEMLKYNSPEDVVSTITDIGMQYYVKLDDRNLHQQILKRNGKVDGLEFRARCKDGTEIWISSSTKAYFDEEGNVIRYEGVVSDITKRKQAELALADSERKWRNVLINTPQIGIVLDPDGRIIFANAHFLKLTGWKEQEVIGQDWFAIFIPDKIKDEVRMVFNRVLGQREALDFSIYENEIITKNGELRNVAWSNLLTKDSNGNIVDITCLGIDLTERKLSEMALRQSEKRYRDIFNNLMDVFFTTTVDGFIETVSPSAEAVLGYSVEELIGKKTDMLYQNPQDREGLLNELKKKGQVRGFELLFKKKNGEPYHISVNADLNYDKKGNPLGLSGTIRDITKNKLAEKEKLIAQQIASESEKLSLVGQVAGKMAHDFNNILGIVMGNAELALIDCQDDGTKKALELIYNQTIRGKNLTKNLVAFAKDQEPKQEFFKIDEKMDLVITLLKKDMEGISVTREYSHDVPEILADPGMIEHAIVNLVQNSIHATSLVERPQIMIRTYQKDERIFIEIEDNGCGVPQEFLGEIFKPSFTLKGSKDKRGMYKPSIKGTGYGMSNVKKYVQQHKGVISIHSELKKGTKVTISLPIIKKELSIKEIEEINKEKISFEKYILLVEDEQAISDVQYRILTHEPCNHKVDIAGNGQVAIDLFSRNKYDLISLDYVLPGGFSGMDIYHHVRETDKTIPILFISGNIEFLESIKGLKQNDPYIGHLSKPCKNIDYLSCINRLLENLII